MASHESSRPTTCRGPRGIMTGVGNTHRTWVGFLEGRPSSVLADGLVVAIPLAFLTAFESLDSDGERATFTRSPLRRRSCRNRMQPPGSQPARSPRPVTQQSIIDYVHCGLSCVQAIATHSIQEFASGDFWTHPPTVSDHRTSKGGGTRVAPMLSMTNTPDDVAVSGVTCGRSTNFKSQLPSRGVPARAGGLPSQDDGEAFLP